MTENKIIGMTDRIVKLWPVVALLVAGISGWLKLKWDVDTLQLGQERWQNGSELRREKSHEEVDSIKTRLTIIETKMADHKGSSGEDCEDRKPRRKMVE